MLQTTGNSLILTLNPVTGSVVTSGLDLGFKVIQAQLLTDFPDEDFLKGILLIDDKIKASFKSG